MVNKVVLAGHSQGALVLAMMLRKFEIDTLRYQVYLDRIFLAVLVGMIGGPFVENGSLTGGWWQTIPVCQNLSDTACVMSWATFKSDERPFPMGHENSLVFNDLLVSKGFIYTTFDSLSHNIIMDPLGFIPAKPVAYSIYPSNHQFFSTHSTYGITTDFIGYTNMYQGNISNPNPSNYRLIIENIQNPNDLRPDPLDSAQTHSLHSNDMYVAIGVMC